MSVVTPTEATARPAWVTVDLAAVRANVAALGALSAPVPLLVAVKADAYGHGAVPVSRAVLEAGATHLGVATVEEGVDLREAGLDAPVVVLSEPPAAAAALVVAHRLTPFVYTGPGIAVLGAAAAAAGTCLPVHLKIDTGMHRVGCRPADALGLVDAVLAHDHLALEGIATHLSAADLDDPAVSVAQLDCFDAVLTDVTVRVGHRPLTHAANSAGVMAFPRARYDLVRVGIAVYGLAPAESFVGQVPLEPALSVHARVSLVKDLPAGSPVSYGGRYVLDRPSRIATVPLGYADGVPRDYGLAGGEVLVGGRRHPIAGIVTMDQLMVDVGDASVEVGDAVVLLGRQGDEEIGAQEWATRLGTITNEIVTRIGPRLPRHYLDGGR